LGAGCVRGGHGEVCHEVAYFVTMPPESKIN
jgi:hypothetical protein